MKIQKKIRVCKICIFSIWIEQQLHVLKHTHTHTHIHTCTHLKTHGNKCQCPKFEYKVNLINSNFLLRSIWLEEKISQNVRQIHWIEITHNRKVCGQQWWSFNNILRIFLCYCNIFYVLPRAETCFSYMFIYFDIYTIHPFSMRDKKNKIESIEFVILLMIYLLYLFICYDAF